MTSHVVDQNVVTAVGEAMRQRYRIEPCAVCGGPEVFSKIHRLSRCLRCRTLREHLAVKQHKTSWRRCALCDKQTMAGVPLNKRYCPTCQALSGHERAKQLRWKAERASRPADQPQNEPINTGLISKAPAVSATSGQNGPSEPSE